MRQPLGSRSRSAPRSSNCSRSSGSPPEARNLAPGSHVMWVRPLQPSVREIVFRTSGRTHGPITRLMSPGDLGELLKPFVFVDLAAFDGRYQPTPMDYGWHPHSGIATVTVMLEGAVRF